MKHEVKLGMTDYSVLVYIPDPASTDGSGKTGLVAANLTVSYVRVETDNDVTVTDVTSSLNNLAALTTAHTDWGILEVSSTLAPGLYRLDIEDAVFAAGAWSAVVYVMITTSAAAASPMEFVLVPESPITGVVLASTVANAITATSLASDTITAAKIADGAIDANTFAAGAITATAVATGAIDADALAADAVDEIIDEAVDGSVTIRQLLRLYASALGGKLSGAATTTVVIRDLADSKDRVTATVDSDGNRTAVTLDLT